MLPFIPCRCEFLSLCYRNISNERSRRCVFGIFFLLFLGRWKEQGKEGEIMGKLKGGNVTVIH